MRLPQNFDSPYRATSIADFWRDWHLTLSRFLRDYLYAPLGGNRQGPLRRHVNQLTTMALGVRLGALRPLLESAGMTWYLGGTSRFVATWCWVAVAAFIALALLGAPGWRRCAASSIGRRATSRPRWGRCCWPGSTTWTAGRATPLPGGPRAWRASPDCSATRPGGWRGPASDYMSFRLVMA